eukprot:488551-Pelagomonas_calceolata.AAC.1
MASERDASPGCLPVSSSFCRAVSVKPLNKGEKLVHQEHSQPRSPVGEVAGLFFHVLDPLGHPLQWLCRSQRMPN